MVIISRYVIHEIEKYFAMILFMVVAIYLVVDFIEKIDDFMEARVPMALAFQYFIFKIPLILSQIIPLATLIAVLVTFGLMGKHNELTALRAGGISLMSLLGPVVRFGIGSFVSVVLLAEIVSPLAMTRANQIWLEKVQHQDIAISRQNDIWLKGRQSIIHLKYYQPETKTASGITINRFDDQFQLIERIDAKTAVFSANRWHLEQGISQEWDPDSGQFAVRMFDCLAERLVNDVQGPYLSISAMDRGDDMDYVGMTVGYVFHHPQDDMVDSNGILYRNGDIIRLGDHYPCDHVLEHCYPIIKVMPGWKETPIGVEKRKADDALPENVQKFIGAVEDFTGFNVISIGNGQDTKNLIYIKRADKR